MDWKKFLKGLNLFDLKASLKTEQAGVVNIKVENTIYNVYNQDTKAVKRSQQIKFSPDLEAKIKSKAEKSLMPIGQVLTWANEATAKEIVVLSTTASLIDISNECFEDTAKKKDDK